jgi:hypothetical protein
MKIFKLLLKPGNVPPDRSELFFVFGFIQCLIENFKNINIDGKNNKGFKRKKGQIVFSTAYFSVLLYIF